MPLLSEAFSATPKGLLVNGVLDWRGAFSGERRIDLNARLFYAWASYVKGLKKDGIGFCEKRF
jgi:hypothetical protein